MKTVVGIRPFSNERSLGLQLSEGWMLVFKMHGKQSNVLLALDDKVTELFRNNFPADRALQPSNLDREINWDTRDLPDDAEEWEKRFITFGKPVWAYLNSLGFAKKPAIEKTQLLGMVRDLLEKPAYYLADTGKSWQLSLLPVTGVVQQFTDPIEAVNVFFQRYHSRHTFEQEKSTVLSALRGRIRQCKTFTDNATRRLSELTGDSHYTQWADLIMANLHRIQTGATEVMLDDFHEPGRQVAVKLRKELSPQKNAEIYYRKAKNQSIERKNVSQALAKKEAELSDLLHREAAVVASSDRETLKVEARILTSQVKEKEKRETMPYRSYTLSGFTILVGKNAAANDDLTLHHTHKEDLWLHARDVAGSHVVIRHRSGKTFPKDVIEQAASLAAWHSRRKNESLCPVSVTPVKYVRKRKGDPPGTVVLQQEKVILVPPRAPEDLPRS